jgi:hypothetical protein
MTRPFARRLRAGTVPALGLLAAALCLGPAQAQMRRPPGFNGQMPGTGGPLFEHVWTCGKCGREIGRGNFPPATCPYCGVRLVNGIGPADPQYNNGNQPAPNNGGPMAPNNPQLNPNAGMMPPNDQGSGTMPPNNQNSGMMPPNNQHSMMPGLQPNNQAGAPPAGVQANPGDVPPALEDPPQAPANAAGDENDEGAKNFTPPAPRLARPVRVLIGLAALFAALVLVVVGGIIVYNLIAANTAEPDDRPRRRRRRRMAEVD